MSANTKQKIVQVLKSQISKPSINVPPGLQKQKAIQTKEENIKGCVFLFKCRMCHISFPGKYEILNHGKKDHNGKMFFEENGVLKRLWTFKCSICPSEFSLQGGTIDHIKKYHGIQKLYCCNDCQAYFTENGLNDHRIKVHQEENFTCPICNVEFSKIENFQTHQCSKKEATVKEKMIEKNDNLNETRIKTKLPTLVMPHKITPIQATPTHVIPIQSTPIQATSSQIIPIQATPTKATPIQATPTKTMSIQAKPIVAMSTQVIPTNTFETVNKLSNEINNLFEKDPLLMDTPTQATLTEATSTQGMHTDTLETVIKTENDKTVTVDEQDPLLVESRELTEKSLVARENSTFSQTLGSLAPSQNIFENENPVVTGENENEMTKRSVEQDPLLIGSNEGTENSLVSRENSALPQILGENTSNQLIFENENTTILGENDNEYQAEVILPDDFLIPTETESDENENKNTNDSNENGNKNANDSSQIKNELVDTDTVCNVGDKTNKNKGNEKENEFSEKGLQEGSEKIGDKNKRGWVFKCSICADEFTEKTALKEHNQTNHEGKKFFRESKTAVCKPSWVFKCTICSLELTSQSEFKKHECKKLESENRHIEKHENPWSQNQYLKRLKSELNRKENREETKETVSTNFKCPYCGFNFSKKDFLRHHIEKVHKQKHKCTICNEIFRTKYMMLKHKNSVHSKNENKLTEKNDINSCEKENDLKEVAQVIHEKTEITNLAENPDKTKVSNPFKPGLIVTTKSGQKFVVVNSVNGKKETKITIEQTQKIEDNTTCFQQKETFKCIACSLELPSKQTLEDHFATLHEESSTKVCFYIFSSGVSISF